ncbi:hypothetical protein SPX_37660 [Sporomusa paucivorans]
MYMNKNKKWYVALGIAAMITVNGIAMAAVTADQQDIANGKRSGIAHKADRPDRHGMKGFKESQTKLLAFLKMDEAAFRAAMKEGKTLAAIAKEQGVSEQSLQNFLIEQMTQRLDEGVKAGKLTAEKAEKIKADMPARVADMINGKGPMHMGPGHMRGHAFDNSKLLALLKMDAATFKTERQAGKTLAAIAKEQGVSEQSLQNFLTEQMTQRLDEGVKTGKLTAEKAEKIKADMPARVAAMINGQGPMHMGPGHMRGHGFDNSELLALLKMDAATFKTERQAGKTLAAIAKEQGVSEQELKDFLVAQMTQRLDEGVKAGKLTVEKADKMKEKMEQRVDNMINSKGHMPKGHGPKPGPEGQPE